MAQRASRRSALARDQGYVGETLGRVGRLTSTGCYRASPLRAGYHHAGPHLNRTHGPLCHHTNLREPTLLDRYCSIYAVVAHPGALQQAEAGRSSHRSSGWVSAPEGKHL